jgi:hypothetical protein
MQTQSPVHTIPNPLTRPQTPGGATGLKVKTRVKAGGSTGGPPSNSRNHNQTVVRGLKIKSKIRAGGTSFNHNQTVVAGLRVKARIKAGGTNLNHNQTVVRSLKIKSKIRAGGVTLNHNQTMVRVSSLMPGSSSLVRYRMGDREGQCLKN